jgi:hypothetical protein
MTDSRHRVEVPIAKHLGGLVQKGVPPATRTGLFFNAEIFVLRWSASIPFDQVHEIEVAQPLYAGYFCGTAEP